jgi:hypothetical protein
MRGETGICRYQETMPKYLVTLAPTMLVFNKKVVPVAASRSGALRGRENVS